MRRSNQLPIFSQNIGFARSAEFSLGDIGITGELSFSFPGHPCATYHSFNEEWSNCPASIIPTWRYLARKAVVRFVL